MTVDGGGTTNSVVLYWQIPLYSTGRLDDDHVTIDINKYIVYKSYVNDRDVSDRPYFRLTLFRGTACIRLSCD